MKDKIFKLKGKNSTKHHLKYITPHTNPYVIRGASALYCPYLLKKSQWTLHIYFYSSMTSVSSHKRLVWFA